jgi:phage baseplate assembly protein W
MATGLSPKFPLSLSEQGDFTNNQTVKELIKQNFKNLLLTVPGERIMYPDFGVGIKRFLFEQKGTGVLENIGGVINSQVKIYLPYIDIVNLNIEDDSVSEEIVYIKITYFIKPLSEQDVIEISAI